MQKMLDEAFQPMEIPENVDDFKEEGILSYLLSYSLV